MNVISFGKKMPQRVALLLVAASLAGCLDEKSDGAASTSVSLAVQPGTEENRPPEIVGQPQMAIEAGNEYSFVPNASDADEDFLEFSVENAPKWARFSAETGALRGVPTDADAGETDEITILVTDGRDTRAIGPFKIRINRRGTTSSGANTPPRISGTPTPAVLVGQPYGFQPMASDAEGNSLLFSISNRPSWATFSPSTGRLSGSPRSNNVTTYSNIVITVSDGRASASLAPFSIQVRSLDNRSPTISGAPGTAVQVTQTYAFQPSASDPDRDPLTYSIANRPAWAAFDAANGRLSGAPASGDVGNYSNIVIGVSDGRTTAALPAFSINVQSTSTGNRAPAISGTPATTATVGGAYSFQPTASDPDGDRLAYSIQNRPSWATFSTTTGRLSGTPAAGTFRDISISVSDGKVATALPTFSIAVGSAPVQNNAPTISGTPSTTASAGVAYNFQPSAADADGDVLAYSIQNRPSWATFSTATGRLSGTPTAGTFNSILISVSDGKAADVALPAFSIQVSQAAAEGNATLSWEAPTQYEDGSSLSTLAGYRIVYGTSAGALTQTVEIGDPGATTYTVDGLTAATWYFAVKAYTTDGTESDLSNVGSKTIQ
jgi:hypothetical protein